MGTGLTVVQQGPQGPGDGTDLVLQQQLLLIILLQVKLVLKLCRQLGSNTAAVLVFTIPSGEKGEKGDPGDDGLGKFVIRVQLPIVIDTSVDANNPLIGLICPNFLPCHEFSISRKS